MPQSAVAPRSKGPQRRLSTTSVRRAASKSWCAARADRPAYVVPWRWRWDAEQAHAPRKGVCQRSAPHTVRAVRAVRTRRSAGRPGRAPACARPRRRRTGTFARETRRATVRADPATPARTHARTPNAAARAFVGCGPSCWASLSMWCTSSAADMRRSCSGVSSTRWLSSDDALWRTTRSSICDRRRSRSTLGASVRWSSRRVLLIRSTVRSSRLSSTSVALAGVMT